MEHRNKENEARCKIFRLSSVADLIDNEQVVNEFLSKNQGITITNTNQSSVFNSSLGKEITYLTILYVKNND